MKTLLLVVGGIWLYSTLANNNGGGPGPTASAPATSAVTQLLAALTPSGGGVINGGGTGSGGGSGNGGILSPILTNNPDWNPYIFPLNIVT